MKIKKLQIKNFQSHKDTALDFDPGLNIIVGPTNSGKSSILRALKKVIRDTPSGNNFVNINEKECTIQIETDTNTITRKVSVSSTGDTKINEYLLDEELFAKFGKEIPLEVIQVLNMPEMEFDNSTVDLNFADQLDGPFLLSASPSLKAKVLGKLSGVDILDRAVIKTNKNIREVTGELKDDNVNREILEKELSEFIDIDACENKLKKIEQDLSTFEKNIVLFEELKKLKVSLDSIVKQGKETKNDLEKLRRVDSISFDTVEATFKTFKELETCYVKLTDFETREQSLDVELKKLSILAQQDSKILSIETLSDTLKSMQDLDFKQRVLFKNIATCEEESTNLNLSYVNKVDELKKFLVDLKLCPTCGQELSEKAIKDMCGGYDENS